MKGIILAGGSGSRLAPLGGAKALMPVGRVPMIYHPLSLLMEAGVREVMIWCSPDNREEMEVALGDGSQWGMTITYDVQQEERGDAAVYVEKARRDSDFFDEPIMVAACDNIIHGPQIETFYEAAHAFERGALILAGEVTDPRRYGVLVTDDDGNVQEVVEKPENPPANTVKVGLYVYDSSIADKAAQLQPSPRGELESTDILAQYVQEGQAAIVNMGRAGRLFDWLDLGVPEDLAKGSAWAFVYEQRTGQIAGCPEAVALRQEWITHDQLAVQALKFNERNVYGQYLTALAQGEERLPSLQQVSPLER